MTKEKIFWICSGSTVGAVIISLIIMTIISRKVYHRSLMASLVAIFLRLSVRHKSDAQVLADAEYLPLKNDRPYHVPRSVRTRKQKRYEYEGMTVVGVNITERTDYVVMYLHGGGYVRQPRLHHWKYINRLSAKVGNVIVPIYPKAPVHHPKEVVEILIKLYRELCDRYDNVIIMGDSSGGGLALVLCQQLGLQDVPQPAKTILFSPWTDLTLSNPDIEHYQRLDPLICAASERIWAQMWADELELTNPLVSPTYGDMSKLGKVLLYAGDREILYPDVCKLYEIMQSYGVDVRLTVGRGMNHVYQIYPIPEARVALCEIEKEIREVA